MHVTGGSYIIECDYRDAELAQVRQELARAQRIIELMQGDIISLDQHMQRSQASWRRVIEVTMETHRGKARAHTALSRIECIAREALL